MRDRFDRIDRGLVRRSAGWSSPASDGAMRELSRAADHSLLWFVVAALLGLRAGQARRGAIRGLVALGFTSGTVNLLGKTLFARRRPADHHLPYPRRVLRRPHSSSFPSGHGASAAAFATGVALESPPAAAALVPLAGAVAYSRVHVGVHWPSDVVAGVLLGTAAGLLTTHFSPVREDEPVSLPPAANGPRLGNGDGVLFVVNPNSGTGAAPAAVREHWPCASCIEPNQDGDLTALVRAHVERDRPAALGVAGGDGTVATLAAVAAETGLPLVVLAGGTLNHFARDAGCSEPPLAATESGTMARTDLATVTVDDHDPVWILNTASLGVYPHIVTERERLEHRIGKWPAAAVALTHALRGAEPLSLTLDSQHHTAWTIFVGNNAYLPSEFTPSYRPSMASGLLDIRIIGAVGPFSRLRFILAALTGSLHETKTYHRTCAETLTIRSQTPVRLATDGEIGPAGTQFEFRNHHNALRVYRDLNTLSTRTIKPTPR